MESLNKVVDQAKDLIGQYTGSTTQTDQKAASTTGPASHDSSAPQLADAPDAVDGLGPTGGAALIEHDGVQNADAPDATQGAPYSATGRDATGSFDGGANDPPNLGAGIMPGRAT
ncbi:hypothetical protein JCM10908_001993 [Rhodotorula pacifica]|uniref:uncharacterized protein n=1 Tax=Rhodotorula pacifica TaxID=1495444 RepID=UPI0031716A86